MAKTLIVFPARMMAKAHVAGYTRKDGVFVKEHDSGHKAAAANAASGNKMHEYSSVWHQHVKNQRGSEAAAFHIGWTHGNMGVQKTFGRHSDDRYDYTEPTSSQLGNLKKHYDAGKNAGAKAAEQFGDAGGISRDAFKSYMEGQRRATPKTKKAPAASSAVKTNNEGWGFHGQASDSYIRGKYGPDFDHGNASSNDIGEARSHADRQFQAAADHLVAAKHFDNHEQARAYLDSVHGRHLHDSSDDGDISKWKYLGKDVNNYKKKLSA